MSDLPRTLALRPAGGARRRLGAPQIAFLALLCVAGSGILFVMQSSAGRELACNALGLAAPSPSSLVGPSR